MTKATLRFSFSLLVFLSSSIVSAQSITESVPEKPDRSRKYLIYLHGGIVQDLGPEAVSEDHGKYAYFDILRTFKESGFNVISEVRPKGTEISAYSAVLHRQVDLLRKRGVKDRNIVVVGASLGAYMAIEAALKLKLPRIRYVLIGLCSEYAIGRYSKYAGSLQGNFLSIYEVSDQKGSCQKVFEPLNRKAKFKEIAVNTGKGHGFLFTPDKSWVNPMIAWIFVRSENASIRHEL